MKVGEIYISTWAHGDIYINQITKINQGVVYYRPLKVLKAKSSNYGVSQSSISEFLKYSRPLTDELKAELL